MTDTPFSLPDGIIWSRYCVVRCTRCTREADMRGQVAQALPEFCATHAHCEISSTRSAHSMTIRETIAAKMMAALVSAKRTKQGLLAGLQSEAFSRDEVREQAEVLAEHAAIYTDALLSELALTKDEASDHVNSREFERIAAVADETYS